MSIEISKFLHFLLDFFLIYADNKSMEDINGLIERFMTLRKKFGPSQDKFGKLLGLSDGTISQIENGRIKINEKHIKLIAGVLGINENWLRTGEGEMFDKKSKPENLNRTFYLQGDETLNQEEAVFMGSYRQLTDSNKIVIRATVDAMLKTKEDANEDSEQNEKVSI